MSEPKLEASLPTGVGFINLRGDAGSDAFCERVREILGQPLPLEANTFSAGEHRVYWLGPDEWLLRCDRHAVSNLVAALETALSGMHVAVNDVSGGNTTVHLSGPRARRTLAKGCTLDLHPREFVPGQCAQSGLAKAPVLIGMIDDAPTFEVVVRRSFGDYLVHWLRHAGEDGGIVFA
jgi:sarcosine oxidase subunit gamma